MFLEEAKWILKRIENHNPKKNIIDLGSGNLHYQVIEQPHITQLYSTITNQYGASLTRVDLEKGEGIDLSCDITYKDCFKKIQKQDIVLLCNVLEHINLERLPQVLENIKGLMNENSYLIVTVPYNIRLHPHPIDNGLRVTPKQLEDLLTPYFKKIVCEYIECSHYKEPYKSNPMSYPKPIVTGGVFTKIRDITPGFKD